MEIEILTTRNLENLLIEAVQDGTEEDLLIGLLTTEEVSGTFNPSTEEIRHLDIRSEGGEWFHITIQEIR